MSGNGGIVGTPPRVRLVEVDDADRAWKADAACRDSDPELWFPGRGESHEQANRICARCPVRQECFDFAMRHGERFGIWGGRSERQRRRLRREQAGAPSFGREPMFTAFQRRRMVWLDTQGWTRAEMAAEFECSVRTIERTLVLERAR